jgi:low temperature requirement protein LtrA
VTTTLNEQSIISPDQQPVSFVELFFDLVFVFSVTQVVALLHDGITVDSVGRAVLVFWLAWWAWTQFTWALNSANTTHPRVELGTLLGTAVAFFMAVALPHAFAGRALWFAVPYVLVRAIGLYIYALVARAADPGHRVARAALERFTTFSLAGLAAVLVGGWLGGTAQYLIWGLTILLDVVAAAVGANVEGWDLHPAHFVERHALFVIIALGESLIVTAAGVTGGGWTSDLMLVATLAVAVTCALWWSYFTRAKPELERALEDSSGAAQSTMARDAFSLMHFPMLCGVVAYGAAVAEAVAHPAEPFAVEWRGALALGLVLFVGGMALAMWRATGKVLTARVVVTLLTAAAVVMVERVTPFVSLALAFVGIAVVCAIEQRAELPVAARAHAHP